MTADLQDGVYATSGARRALVELPGIRALRAPGFRLALGVTLLAVGTVIMSGLLQRQAADPNGQFGNDFGDYWIASTRIGAGDIPYQAEMLSGPLPAQGLDRYRYPPPLAQALVPLRPLGFQLTAWLWLFAQAAAMWAALWIASGLRGKPRSGERALWCAVAVVFFVPCFDTLWKCNVSGFQALQLALVGAGGLAGGAALATAALLKPTPLALAPAALHARGPLLRGLLIAGLLLLGLSVLLSPAAWVAYGQVLANMLSGHADYANNLAPAAVAANAGLPAVVVDGVRLGTLLLAASAVVAAILLARRPGGWPAAVAMAMLAMLLAPAALWYHYLVIALVPAAMAWSRATVTQRVALFVGGALVSFALVALPLALLGTGLMFGVSLRLLWPVPRGVAPQVSA